MPWVCVAYAERAYVGRHRAALTMVRESGGKHRAPSVPARRWGHAAPLCAALEPVPPQVNLGQQDGLAGGEGQAHDKRRNGAVQETTLLPNGI